MHRPISAIATCLFLISTSGCNDGHLRGSVVESDDGNTYLAVSEDHDGNCRPIFVDGVEWPYSVGEKAQIEPGLHTIGCGGEIQFEIPEGVVFSFDYWGP